MILKNLRQKNLATIARCSRAWCAETAKLLIQRRISLTRTGSISSFAAFLRRNNHVFERHSWTSLAIKSEIVGKDDGK